MPKYEQEIPAAVTSARKNRRCAVRNLAGALIAGAALATTLPAAAQRSDATGWRHPEFFVQSGVTASDTLSYTVGATWNWDWERGYNIGTVTGYTEFTVGRWKTAGGDGQDDGRWVTQVGITPVLRLYPNTGLTNWFVEAGVGANVIMPVYSTGDRQFSTEFNFGDHIGVGRVFGTDSRQELVLRLQHFSNGGVKEPNPGENFVQIRYSSRY